MNKASNAANSIIKPAVASQLPEISKLVSHVMSKKLATACSTRAATLKYSLSIYS